MLLSRLVICLTAPVALTACSPLTLLNVIIGDDGYSLRSAVSYGTESRQVLDVYAPSPQAERPPIVIFFYGGSWQDGNRAEYRFVADALTSRGYITVVPDYRVYPEHRFPVFIEDGAQAVSWVMDHAEEIGGDPERVYLMGHSAGAHIAAMLTLDERYLSNVGVPSVNLAGTIALAGPYAFYPSRTANVAPVFAHLADEDLARPITFVDGSEPPFLLLHGAEDTTVFTSNTAELSAAVRNAGGQVTQKLYPDIGHFKILLALADPLPDYAPVLIDAANFIDGGQLARQE
ncbi:MAG: alpha/beta hydrolase [Gammaproteobacteria bacterium]